MKYYNDLRDYHNQKFMQDNFTDFALAALNTFMLQICNNMSTNNPIITFLYITIIGEIYAIETIRNKKIFNKLDLQKIIRKRNNIYNEILDNLIKYIREKNIKDPVNIMHFLHNTIFDGYLSYNKKFKNINPHDYDLKLSPFEVILGKGVCRNINILATDIFKKLNYEATDIFCTEYKQNMLIHVITKVKYNNEFYYLDTQNNDALELKQNILFVKGNPAYEPINFKNKKYDDEESILSLLLDYYQRKRNKKELLVLIHNQEENKIIKQIEKLDNIEPNQIYEQNKKLYKKFKKTYL